jgi:hypothetical protein
MKSEIPTVPGTPYQGGFYAGRINLNGLEYALIVASKDLGEHDPAPWNDSLKSVSGALSYVDGFANTEAMVTAGSDLAKWARGLNIDGFDDWYLPSVDELEVCYRALKPTTNTNWLYARSGINVSAVPPTYPYTSESPAQTTVEDFRENGPQAFTEEGFYWTSTQHANGSDYAWMQYFGDGYQGYGDKDDTRRARAVRKIKV